MKMSQVEQSHTMQRKHTESTQGSVLNIWAVTQYSAVFDNHSCAGIQYSSTTSIVIGLLNNPTNIIY